MTPQTRFISRYEIQRRLGQGGMGVLYLARDPHIDRLVAVKLLHGEFADDEMRRRFVLEAKSSGGLSHPNIVTVHDFGEYEGAPFIVMEYVRGDTLAALIQRATPISIIQKLEWMEQVCAGFSYAHGVGIIHRDIKPSNLMVDQHGRMKILDFGIARLTGTGPVMMSMIVGTPGYMSPEQIQGGMIDVRSDVFSLGAVLYEILSYRPAFPGDNPHTIMHRVLSTNPAPLTPHLGDHDGSIIEVVNTALAKNVAERYSSMAAFQAAIARSRLTLEAFGSAPTRSTPIPTPAPAVVDARPLTAPPLRAPAAPAPATSAPPASALPAPSPPAPAPAVLPPPATATSRAIPSRPLAAVAVLAIVLIAVWFVLLRLPSSGGSGLLGSSETPELLRASRPAAAAAFVPLVAAVAMSPSASAVEDTPDEPPQVPSVAGRAAAAEAAEAAGNLDLAVVHYSALLRADPGNVEAQRGIARIRAERRNTADRLVRRANDRFEAADYDGAAGDLNRALAADPGHREAAALLEKVRLARAADAKRRRVPQVIGR